MYLVAKTPILNSFLTNASKLTPLLYIRTTYELKGQRQVIDPIIGIWKSRALAVYR